MASALWQSLGFFVVLMAELAVLFIVVSVLVGLLRGRAPFGAVASFLLASLLVNPVVRGLFFVLSGLRWWSGTR